MISQLKTLLLLLPLTFIIASCGKDPYLREEIQTQAWNHLSVGVGEYTSLNLSSSRIFLEKALEEAESIDNLELQIKSLLSLAELELLLKNFSEASNNIFKAWLLSDYMDTDEVAFSLNSTTGKYYSKLNEYEKAIEYYNKAYLATKDKQNKAIIYNNLGVILRSQKKYEEAMEYFNKAVRFNKRKGIYDSLASNYYNIGELYYQQNKLDSALEYFFMALENDKLSEDQFDILADLKKIGIIYSDKNELQSALHYFIRALNLAYSIENEEEIEAITQLIKDIDPDVLIDWGFITENEDDDESVTFDESTNDEPSNNPDTEKKLEGEVKIKVEEVKE